MHKTFLSWIISSCLLWVWWYEAVAICLIPRPVKETTYGAFIGYNKGIIKSADVPCWSCSWGSHQKWSCWLKSHVFLSIVLCLGTWQVFISASFPLQLLISISFFLPLTVYTWVKRRSQQMHLTVTFFCVLCGNKHAPVPSKACNIPSHLINGKNNIEGATLQFPHECNSKWNV